MAVSTDNSKLYVSDITDLVEINIANGQITNRYNAPGGAFLMMLYQMNREISMYQIQALMLFTNLTIIINHHYNYGYKTLN